MERAHYYRRTNCETAANIQIIKRPDPEMYGTLFHLLVSQINQILFRVIHDYTFVYYFSKYKQNGTEHHQQSHLELFQGVS